MDGLRRCPVCGSLPRVASSKENEVMFYCHEHQYIHTAWYPSYKKAESEWINAGFIEGHGLACKCPQCNETPVITESVWSDNEYIVTCKHGHGRLFCAEFCKTQNMALEKWNTSVREAIWDKSVREVMTPKSPNTVSTIAFTNEDHDKFISFLSEEV